MTFEGARLSERGFADVANMGLLSRMRQLVLAQVAGPSKGELALIALVRPLPRVRAVVGWLGLVRVRVLDSCSDFCLDQCRIMSDYVGLCRISGDPRISG